jgi:hypothetical protein
VDGDVQLLQLCADWQAMLVEGDKLTDLWRTAEDDSDEWLDLLDEREENTDALCDLSDNISQIPAFTLVGLQEKAKIFLHGQKPDGYLADGIFSDILRGIRA